MNGFKIKKSLIQAAVLGGLGMFAVTFSMVASDARVGAAGEGGLTKLVSPRPSSSAPSPSAGSPGAHPRQLGDSFSSASASCFSPELNTSPARLYSSRFLASTIFSADFSAEFVERLKDSPHLVNVAGEILDKTALASSLFEAISIDMSPVCRVESLITSFMRVLLTSVRDADVKEGGYPLKHIVEHLGLALPVIPQIRTVTADYLPYLLVNALDQVECLFDAVKFYESLHAVDVVKLKKALMGEVVSPIQGLMLSYHCQHIQTSKDIVEQGIIDGCMMSDMPEYVKARLKNGCW